MSGSENGGGDWGPAQEALFRASRTDHDATPGDRARVAEALARRLGATHTPSTQGHVGASDVSTRAGGLVTIGNGVKLALVVVLTAGTISLTRRVQPSPEHTETAEREAPASAVLDVRPDVKPVASLPEAVPEMPLRRSEEASRVAGAEGAQARRHAARSLRAPEERKGKSHAGVLPRGATTVPLEASEETEKPNVGRPARPESNGESAATPLASPERALSVATATTENDGSSREPRAELAWFERIHAAMRAGQNSTALALCDGHEKRWPQGVFAVEREGVRAIAACALRTGDAAARARAYLRAYPGTPLVPRVMAACRELSDIRGIEAKP